MRARTTITPGDRVTVEIPYSHRSVLRPLFGKLRTVEVTAEQRALIYDDDGRRYRFNGRTVAPVTLAEVSIFTDRATGQLWAESYSLPPRDSSPFPLSASYAAMAEPDGQGGIARMSSCRCGRGCVCGACGRQTTLVAFQLEWTEVLPSGEVHRGPECRSPSCSPDEPVSCLDCCALPMRLSPVGWICRRDSKHLRPFQWPEPPLDSAKEF